MGVIKIQEENKFVERERDIIMKEVAAVHVPKECDDGERNMEKR